MSNKIDARAAKTYAIIFKSLDELLQDKNFSELSVLDITNHAKIHRTTFYKRFKDKNDALEAYIQNCFKCLNNQVFDLNHYRTPQEYYLSLLGGFFDVIYENKSLYNSLILKDEKNYDIVIVLMHLLRQMINDKIKEVENFGIIHRTSSELLAAVYSGALVSLIIFWKEHKNVSKQELYTTLNRIILK